MGTQIIEFQSEITSILPIFVPDYPTTLPENIIPLSGLNPKIGLTGGEA